jgi:predicted metal-binding membrane protein
MGIPHVLRSFGRAPWPLLFGLSAFGDVLSASSTAHATLPSFCGTGAAMLLSAGWPGALHVLLGVNQPAQLAAEWALMILAMMPPLLALPLAHVWRSSLARRRIRAVSCFVLAYAAIWMFSAPLLLALGLLLQILAGPAALAAAVSVAVLWSAGPWHRAALNRGHRVRRIGIFGPAADGDCLRFGAAHGTWCLLSCWAWMLVPLAAGPWHLPAMVFSGIIMLVERLAPPAMPKWQWPAFLSVAGRALMLPQKVLQHG